MYVRNYGMPPRAAVKADEPHSAGISARPEPFSDEKNTMDNADRLAAEEASPPQSTAEGTSVEEASDSTIAVPVFGSSGISRQPLRRRKIPKKTEEHGKSPQNSENQHPQSDPLYPFICSGEPPAADTRVHNTEPAPQPKPCESKHNQPSSHRKTLGCLSTEELLLGGLILLMLNDHASDDILLILAFLLVSDLDLSKREN